jgi:hypothetical protein
MNTPFIIVKELSCSCGAVMTLTAKLNKWAVIPCDCCHKIHTVTLSEVKQP